MKPLNPIMAALVIASVGAMPLRTLANDGKPIETAVDTNPVNALRKVLAENTAARADAGRRMEDFLFSSGPGGERFVGKGVNETALKAVARDWAVKSSTGSVAQLYFVLGPGPVVPSWAQKDPILEKTFLPDLKWEKKLRIYLADWTGKSQIDKKREKSQVSAFLNDAAAKAVPVLEERSKSQIVEDVNANNNTASNPPKVTTNPSSRLDGAIREYSLADLYETGAIVTNVAGPKDKNSRKISMKIYTRRTPPPENKTYDEIGIFDITDPNDIFGQRFPLDSATQSFTLDDRTPGHKKYELKIETIKGGNREITFSRPGDGGHSLKTDVSDLLTRRANQAANMGIVKVGGEEFYALPQGGSKGALVLFSKTLLDRRDSIEDKRKLEPALYAEVGQRGPDGRNQNIGPGPNGGPHLGTVGNKPYKLVYNKSIGAWEVKEGEGDLPKVKDEASTSTTTANGGGNGGGGGNTGGGDSKVPVNSDGEKTIADMENLLLKLPDCKKNPDDTKDLAPGLKGKFGIIACNGPEGWKQVILVPKAVSEGQQLEYKSVPASATSPAYKLLRARFFDHYLVLQFDKQVQYLDLTGKDFPMAGFIADKNASKFTDVGPFVDALRNYMGIAAGSADAGAFTEVPKRVAAAAGSKPYLLSGAYTTDTKNKVTFMVHVASGGESLMIWPEVMKPGAGPDKTPNPYTSLSGPANVMDGSVSSVDAVFPDKIDLPESRQAKATRVETDIALYETLDLDGKKEPKKYYVMFKYNAFDPKDPAHPEGEKVKKVFRQKPFEVFNAANPFPDGLQLQGLTGDAVVDDRVASGYKFIGGSSKEKGVLAVFQNKQISGESVKNKPANCVGPVVWWGMDRDAALKVCRNEKF